MAIEINITSRSGIHFANNKINGYKQSPAIVGYATSTVSPTNLLAYFQPIIPARTGTLASITVQNTTTGVGALARVVMYDSAGTLVWESADIPCSSLAVTTVLLPANTTLKKGETYFFGIYTNATITFKAIPPANLHQYGRIDGGSGGLTIIRGSVPSFGSPPASLWSLGSIAYVFVAMPELLFDFT